jgi:hypothetical protein
MCGECREDSCAYAGIAIAAAIPEDGVGFIHDDHDRPKRTNGHENSRLLPFRVADPFAAELAEFEYRQSALAREAIDEEGFSDADSAGDENASLDNVVFALAEKPGDVAQLCFGGGVCGDSFERDAGFRIFEPHEALAVFLDEPLLCGRYVFIRNAMPVLYGLGEEVVDSQQA